MKNTSADDCNHFFFLEGYSGDCECGFPDSLKQNEQTTKDRHSDPCARRTGKPINGTTTSFVFDALNQVKENDGATVTANLLTGFGIDEFFRRADGGGVRSLLPDELGDSAGTLQAQYTYEPFGFVSQTGAAAPASTSTQAEKMMG